MNLLQQVREILDLQPAYAAHYNVAAESDDAVIVWFEGKARLGLQQLNAYKEDLKKKGFTVKLMADRAPGSAATVSGTRTPHRTPTGRQGDSYLRVTAG